MLGGWSTAVETGLTRHARPGICEQPALNTGCLLFVGWGLARSGDLAGARETLARIRKWETEAEGRIAQIRGQYGDLVEGTIAAEEARVVDARRLLGPVASGTGNQGTLARAALAEVELAEGNVAEAIRHYSGNLYSYNRFQSVLGLARIHEHRGESDQARAYYRSFLTITREGDPDRPEIVEAREALARLGG